MNKLVQIVYLMALIALYFPTTAYGPWPGLIIAAIAFLMHALSPEGKIPASYLLDDPCLQDPNELQWDYQLREGKKK